MLAVGGSKVLVQGGSRAWVLVQGSSRPPALGVGRQEAAVGTGTGVAVGTEEGTEAAVAAVGTVVAAAGTLGSLLRSTEAAAGSKQHQPWAAVACPAVLTAVRHRGPGMRG